MTISERRARMLLGCALDGGDLAAAELVRQRGAQEAWLSLLEGALGDPAAQRAARVPTDLAERLGEAVGARFVIPGDEEWPPGLADLARAEPIQRRGGEPLGLWLRGPGRLTELSGRSVAIVGSRAATAYGSGLAADLAADLAEQGMTVISGGAFGIDAAAHRGALAVGGRTVGALANGVDVGYPPGNSALFEALGRDHLLVSELPPGAHPTRVRFLARNRLIAALAGGTIVVEAALRSGARNTAGWALACGRPLMAVPGSVHSGASAGPHLMIRSGQATLVTSAAEVLELLAPMGDALLPQPQGPRRATDALTETELAVYEALSARRRRSAGEAALAADVSVPICLSALHALEAAGLATGDERGWLALVGGLRVR